MRATTTPHDTALAPGRRVHICRYHPAYALTNRVGTIAGADPIHAGHYVVRLDEPATYIRPDGRTEGLGLVIEPGDNLEVLLSEPPARATRRRGPG